VDPVLPTLKLAVVKEGAKELAGDHREQLDKVLVESRFKKKAHRGFQTVIPSRKTQRREGTGS